MIGRIIVLLILLRDILLMPIVVLFPRKRNKILFGAWSGRQYACNPRYLMEYMLERGRYDCVWVGEKRLKNWILSVHGARFAEKGSLCAFWHFLTARFFAFNVYWGDDIMRFPICKRVHLLYLTHGSPDKKTGDKQYAGNGYVEAQINNTFRVRQVVRKWIKRLDIFLYPQAAWCSATSSQGEEIRLSNMGFRLSKERMIHCGTPRFDYLMHNAANDELKQRLKRKYSKLLGIDCEKKWYVFVPTWRHNLKNVFSFCKSNRIEEYQQLLDRQNAVLIEKQHPKIFDVMDINGGITKNICVVDRKQSNDIDMQELLLACDRLITDYSSVYYDFYVINRPVIHWTYDFDEFMGKDMGFNFDIREYGGGPFAYNEDEMFKYLAMDDGKLLSLRNEKTREQLQYETGHACEGYCELIDKLAKQNKYFVP